MTVRQHHPARWLVVGLLLSSTGCGTPLSSDHPIAGNDVTARIWGLRDLQGNQVTASGPRVATLRFLPDHGVAGTTSCNHVDGQEYHWSADASGNAGTFAHDPSQPMIMTAVGCPDAEAMKTGDHFWDMMATARTWSISSGMLTIDFADGSRAALVPFGKVLPPKNDCDDPASRNFDCPLPAGKEGR